VLTCGGESAGGRARWRPAAAAAGVITPVIRWLGVANKRGWDLCWRKGGGGAGAARVGERPEGGVHRGGSYGRRQLVTRANARGGKLDSLYRHSCLGEGVTVWRKGGARWDGQW
jgi:hypothetical protein